MDGIVRDAHIELEGGVRLTEGTRVEVRPRPADAGPEIATEADVQARLRAASLLAPALPADVEDDLDFDPVEVAGEPLSEQIIRERR
jgi:hypothetical protein